MSITSRRRARKCSIETERFEKATEDGARTREFDDRRADTCARATGAAATVLQDRLAAFGEYREVVTLRSNAMDSDEIAEIGIADGQVKSLLIAARKSGGALENLGWPRQPRTI